MFGVTIDPKIHGGPIRHMMLIVANAGSSSKLTSKVQALCFNNMELRARADGPDAQKNLLGFKGLLELWSRPSMKTKAQCVDCWEGWIEKNKDSDQITAKFATYNK